MKGLMSWLYAFVLWVYWCTAGRLFRFMKRHVLFSVSMICVFGVGYTHNREIFPTMDYETTYTMRDMDRVCILSTCNPGLELDIVNTGHKQSSQVEIFINNLPRYKRIKTEVEQEYFYIYRDKYPSRDPVEYVEIKSLGHIRYVFYNVPSKWHLNIIITTDYTEMPIAKWDEAYVQIKGRGSLIEENPYKVVVLKTISEMIDIIRGAKNPANLIDVDQVDRT